MRIFFQNIFQGLVGDVGLTNEINRVQWLEKTLSKISAGKRVLDAGAGTQRFKHLCSHLEYISQDFAQYDGRGDNSGLQTGAFDYGTLDIVSDIINIPEPDSSFDAILCTEVLEHIPSPEPAIREFSRLLKVGGELIVTAPFCSLTHFAPYHYATGFNRYFYEYNLKKYGFEIIEIQANGNFFEYLAQELRRTNEIAQRYTKSQLFLFEKLALFILLSALQRFKRSDQGSFELLCYGYHIHAKKRIDNLFVVIPWS